MIFLILYIYVFFYNVLKIPLKLKSMTNHIYFLFGKGLLHYSIFMQLSSFKPTFAAGEHLSLSV